MRFARRTCPSSSRCFNEAGTIEELHRRLTAVLFLIGQESEIVYVDDGSTDGTAEALSVIAGALLTCAADPAREELRPGPAALTAAGFDGRRPAM